MLRARPVEDRHVRASARREGLRLQAINQGALARVGLARSARQRFSDAVVPLRMVVVGEQRVTKGVDGDATERLAGGDAGEAGELKPRRRCTMMKSSRTASGTRLDTVLNAEPAKGWLADMKEPAPCGRRWRRGRGGSHTSGRGGG